MSALLTFACICAQSLRHVSLFVNPWTIEHQVSLSMEFPSQEYWSGLPFSPPGDLPNPGIEPVSSALAGRISITEPPGKLHAFVYLMHLPLYFAQNCYLENAVCQQTKRNRYGTYLESLIRLPSLYQLWKFWVLKANCLQAIQWSLVDHGWWQTNYQEDEDKIRNK